MAADICLLILLDYQLSDRRMLVKAAAASAGR